MWRVMMKSKIHRATITQADLNYMGSITIDRTLMEAADILPNEKVQIVNNNNGARFETYVIEGERDSGIICVNGAAARLVQPGDIIIVISYAMVAEQELSSFRSKVVFVDAANKIADISGKELAGTLYS
jgi:aspartate 1-decarboxylase